MDVRIPISSWTSSAMREICLSKSQMSAWSVAILPFRARSLVVDELLGACRVIVVSGRMSSDKRLPFERLAESASLESISYEGGGSRRLAASQWTRWMRCVGAGHEKVGRGGHDTVDRSLVVIGLVWHERRWRDATDDAPMVRC